MITVTRDEPPRYEVVISPFPSRNINKTRLILKNYNIPEVGAGGGSGYIVGDGELLISGHLLDVYPASRLIQAPISAGVI